MRYQLRIPPNCHLLPCSDVVDRLRWPAEIGLQVWLCFVSSSFFYIFHVFIKKINFSWTIACIELILCLCCLFRHVAHTGQRAHFESSSFCVIAVVSWVLGGCGCLRMFQPCSNHRTKVVKSFSGCHRNSQWYVYSSIMTSVGDLLRLVITKSFMFCFLTFVVGNPPRRFVAIRWVIFSYFWF